MRNLKFLILAIITCAITLSLNAQENLNLTAPLLAPAPMGSVESNGSGCFSFSIQNVNNPGYPNAGDTEIEIQLDLIAASNGVADLSSDLSPGAYDWSYDSGTNTYTGIQSGPIGFLYSETITVCFDVIANSPCPVEELGFTATGTINSGDDGNTTDNIASSYTCTEESIVLPVVLSHFTASRKDATSALAWTTATEVNNSHFIVERSTDGQTFEEIGKVEGHGTTSSFTQYTFIDLSPVTGKNYYRLNQYDFDGRNDKSEIRVVEFVDTKTSITVFPNPAVDFIRVSHVEEEAKLEFYNMSGKLAYVNTISEDTVVSTKSLAGGTYILQVLDIHGNKLHTEKIVVNK